MIRRLALQTTPSLVLSAGLPRSDLPPRLRPHATLGVLDVTKYFGSTSGGIKTYLLEKARYVGVHPGLRQVMVIPGVDDRIDTSNGSRIYRLRGPRIPMNPPYRFLLATSSFRRVVDHERPNVIEVGSPFLVPWLARLANRRLQAPMVWFYHSHIPRLAVPDPDQARFGHRLAERLLSKYVRHLGDRFPVVICASDFAARELADLGVSRIARVPLGVDLHTFHPGRRAWGAETRRDVGLPDGPVALFVGRFAGEKRLDVLLDAWAEVERRCRVRLALLGAGPIEPSLRTHPYASRVLWLPYQSSRDRMADLMAAVDFVVAPGPNETFGLAVLESLASGTPVLSVDEGGAAELVASSGAGVRYRSGEPAHCAEMAVVLAKSNLPALGAKARAYACQGHGWDTVFDQLFRVYGDVAGVRPDPRG